MVTKDRLQRPANDVAVDRNACVAQLQQHSFALFFHRSAHLAWTARAHHSNTIKLLLELRQQLLGSLFKPSANGRVGQTRVAVVRSGALERCNRALGTELMRPQHLQHIEQIRRAEPGGVFTCAWLLRRFLLCCCLLKRQLALFGRPAGTALGLCRNRSSCRMIFFPLQCNEGALLLRIISANALEGKLSLLHRSGIGNKPEAGTERFGRYEQRKSGAL